MNLCPLRNAVRVWLQLPGDRMPSSGAIHVSWEIMTGVFRGGRSGGGAADIVVHSVAEPAVEWCVGAPVDWKTKRDRDYVWRGRFTAATTTRPNNINMKVPKFPSGQNRGP
jgi:hypothetical protein